MSYLCERICVPRIAPPQDCTTTHPTPATTTIPTTPQVTNTYTLMARSPCSPKDLTALAVNPGRFIARKIQLKALKKSLLEDYPKGWKDAEGCKYLKMAGRRKKFWFVSFFPPSGTFLSSVRAGHLCYTASHKITVQGLNLTLLQQHHSSKALA